MEIGSKLILATIRILIFILKQTLVRFTNRIRVLIDKSVLYHPKRGIILTKVCFLS